MTLPGGQSKQVMVPVLAAYWPVGQFMQPVAAVPALNVPSAQAVHKPPAAPEYPALQTHAVMPVDNAGDMQFEEGHGEHELAAAAE